MAHILYHMTTPGCKGVGNKSPARWAWFHGNTAMFLNKGQSEGLWGSGDLLHPQSPLAHGGNSAPKPLRGESDSGSGLGRPPPGKAEKPGFHPLPAIKKVGLGQGLWTNSGMMLGSFNILFLINLSAFSGLYNMAENWSQAPFLMEL